MGHYIEVPRNHGKAEQIRDLHGATIIGSPPSWADIPEDQFAVCVVDNGMFEAAGIAYDEKEFDVFNESGDPRSKTWVLIDREKAFELEPHLRERLAELAKG